MARGIPFKYGRRRCIFCTRQPPDVTISKEHVFADWLRDIFPRDDKTTHTMGIVDWLFGPIPPFKLKHGQGHSGSKKVKAVCATCNQVWLSNNVEDAAKPILIPLIENTKLTINVNMQRILATWAAKTAMTAEQIHADKGVIQQSERTWLKDDLSPPNGWNIWIGSYGGSALRDLGIFQHMGRLEVSSVDKNAPTEHNLQLTMIGMRHLLFLILNSSWPNVWDILDSLGSPNSVDLARIWPIREPTVLWPRSLYLLDPAVEYFTTYLARVLDQPVQP
jgi:hypothetical protein